MEVKLIDFGIDFTRYKFNNLTYNIRIFDMDYLEFEVVELKDVGVFKYNSKAYSHLKSYKDEVLDIFLKISDNYYFFNINSINRGFKEYSINENIKLNHLIYKIQDIEYIKEIHKNQEIKFISIKYFLYNKEQNRTITLYDHQIKFIQENFNKT